MFRFREFPVYSDAQEFLKFCFDKTRSTGIESIRSLVSQIQRAAISIVLNIAEGSALQSDAEFRRFLGIALRSVYEVVAAFEIALELGKIKRTEFDEVKEKAEELAKQLSAFRNSLKNH